jgi:hypothetical protein
MPFPITCTACGKMFSIADEIYERKVKGRVVTIKCKQCLAGIRVDDTHRGARSEHAFGSSPAANEHAANEPARPAAVVAPRVALESAASKPISKPRSDALAASAPQEPLASLRNAGKPPVALGTPRPQPLAAMIGLKAQAVPTVAHTESSTTSKALAPATAIKASAAASFGTAKTQPSAEPKRDPFTSAAPVARVAEPTAVSAQVDASPATKESESSSDETLWAVDYPDGQDRELTSEQIALERAAGAIDDVTLVWREGMSEWKELREMRELLALTEAVAPATAILLAPAPTTASLAQRSIALTVPEIDLPMPEANAMRAPSSPRAAEGSAPRAASNAAPRASSPSATGLLGPPAPRVRAPSSPGPLEPPPPRVASPSSPGLVEPLASRVTPPSSPSAAQPLGSRPRAQSSPELAEPNASQSLEPSRPFATFSSPRATGPTNAPRVTTNVVPAPATFAGSPPRAASFAPLVSTNAAEPLFSIPPPSVAVPTRSTVTADEWPRSRRRGPLVVGLLGLLILAGGAFFYLRRSASDAPPQAVSINALPANTTALPQVSVSLPATSDSKPVDGQAAPSKAASPGLMEAPSAAPSTAANAGFAELFASSARKAEEKHAVGGPAQHFDANLARAALAGVAGLTASCREKGGPVGRATIVVTFAATGKVASATLSDAPFAGTSSGACIATTMKRASIPPFSGPPGTVIKVISVY